MAIVNVNVIASKIDLRFLRGLLGEEYAGVAANRVVLAFAQAGVHCPTSDGVDYARGFLAEDVGCGPAGREEEGESNAEK